MGTQIEHSVEYMARAFGWFSKPLYGCRSEQARLQCALHRLQELITRHKLVDPWQMNLPDSQATLPAEPPVLEVSMSPKVRSASSDRSSTPTWQVRLPLSCYLL